MRSGVLPPVPIPKAAVVAFLATTLWAGFPCPAQEQPRCFLVRIPVPIVGNVDERVKREVEQLLGMADASAERPVLVLEFWPPDDESEGAGSQFERSYALANYLSSERLNKIRTVAYLPRTIVGHALLPVMACEEIIIHPDAKLGDAGRGLSAISMTVRGAYREIANRRRTVPEAIALAMLDEDLKVWKLDTATGHRFVLDEDLASVQEELAVDEISTLVEAGAPALLTSAQLRSDCEIVSQLARDRRDLGEALGVKVADLEPDPSRGGDWNAVQAQLTGVISDQAVNRVQRVIEDALRSGDVNFVCLILDSPGGSPTASLRLASYLAGLDSSQVRSVAYVSHEARGDAALVALACDHLVLEAGSVLGGPGAHEPSLEEIDDILVALKQLAKEKSRHWSLPAAIIDPRVELRKFMLAGTDVTEYFSASERAEQADPARWTEGDLVSPAGELLRLDAKGAEELGVARFSVDGFEEFKALYQLENDPTIVKPNWAHEFVDYIAEPHVAAALLFFAGFALMTELASPGLGFGGFVAAVCFVLFFWSQFLNGTATWLEILLFFTGLAFIAIEIFVLPGFGVFGVGGVLMLIASIILASQTFIVPQNAYQMEQLPRSLLTLLAAGGGLGIGLVVLNKYMDKAPLLRRVMLTPPEQSELEEREALVSYDHLLHQRGKTTTPLVPAGKARFGSEIVSVISEGPAIDRGISVEVTEVAGNRVVVQPLVGT
jgi:membrane-bound serine protease (ClpP class)